jgi:CRP-like cAMP-binding protein
VRHAIDGSEVTLHVARDGETFAEASLFAARYHCDAIADLPSTVLQFDKAAVLASLAADPERSCAGSLTCRDRSRDCAPRRRSSG